MPATLQRMVDAIAARLDRSAVLEDPQQRMVAYSQHDDEMDTVRRQSILRRRAAPEVIDWLRRCRIAESDGPVRTPGNAALDMQPRVCIPVRRDDLLLGFLWFLDGDQQMPESDIQIAASTTHELALAMYRDTLADELAQRREGEAVRNLLTCDPPVQARAMRELVDGGMFVPGAAVVALVVRAVPVDADARPDERLRLGIEQALAQSCRSAPPREALRLGSCDHGLLLVRAEETDRSPALSAYAQSMIRHLETIVAGLDDYGHAVVGIGEPQPSLREADRSQQQAHQAAQLAAGIPSLGPIAEWSNLGIYRAVAQLSDHEVTVGSLHHGLVDLFAADPALVDTLETYLDLAGSVQDAAATLSVHRTTLYYRLQRIEEIADVSLNDGGERLALHFALKLARLRGTGSRARSTSLAGAHPGSQAVG